MNTDKLSVREITKTDIELIVSYWLNAEDSYLLGMGVDLTKMLTRADWIAMLEKQLYTPIAEKQSFCMIWLLNDRPVGHSNVNKIIFGDNAFMHLHIWYADIRKKGYGVEFIKMTLPWFFEKLQLKKLYCEPYALNPAPHRTVEKAGFRFVKEYITIPGTLNYEQPVKQWEITEADLKAL